MFKLNFSDTTDSKKMYWKPLNKEQSTLFKAIAILMIATHNFMHKLSVIKENEFSHSPDRFTGLFRALIASPENCAQDLLSFFGHFGVQIFIFLSAYGLVKKYGNRLTNTR